MLKTHKALNDALALLEGDTKLAAAQLSDDIATARQNIADLEQKAKDDLDEHERLSISQRANIKEMYTNMVAMEERRVVAFIARRDKLTKAEDPAQEPEKPEDQQGGNVAPLKRKNGH